MKTIRFLSRRFQDKNIQVLRLRILTDVQDTPKKTHMRERQFIKKCLNLMYEQLLDNIITYIYYYYIIN